MATVQLVRTLSDWSLTLACQGSLLVPPSLLHALPGVQAAGVNLLFDAHLVCWHLA